MITRWAAVSPFGSAPGDFAAGLRTGSRPVRALDPHQWPVPEQRAGQVPGFELRTAVGPKGIRNMDRLTGLAVAAAGQLLGGPEVPGAPPRLAGVDERASVVLGTDSGSVASMMDFTRDSLVNERPYFVPAAHFPNVAMNCAAAQIAIRHTLRGPNATVAGGRIAGLLALRYADRLHRAGRAEVVVCAAAEEYTTHRAWLAHHTGVTGPLAEGCAALLLESAEHARVHGRAPLASLAALAFGVVADDGAVRPALTALLRRALADAAVPADGVWAVVTSGGPDAEQQAVADTITAPVVLDTTDLIGDSGAASCTFGILAALDLAERRPAGGGRSVVVTGVDRDGGIGCLVLGLPPTGAT